MAYKEGMEHIPFNGLVRDLPVLVLIYDLATDDLVKEIRLNYGDMNDRKYLGRLSFWALTNHHTVETIAVVDAEAEKDKGK